tara:strand:- start:3892 stop:4329 length:438 start_codon:yes stop_codon:yes gene_type:complete
MRNKFINNNIFNYLIYILAILNVIFYLIYNLYIELIQFILFVILGYLLCKRNIIFIIIVGVILINIIIIDKIYNRKSIIEGNDPQPEDPEVDQEKKKNLENGASELKTASENKTDGSNGSNEANIIINKANEYISKIFNIATTSV